MISAMTSKMLKMSIYKKLHAQYHNESVEMEEDEVISESLKLTLLLNWMH